MTLFTLRFVKIRALLISFIANSCFYFLRSTFHTFPKPPLPTQNWYWKLDLLAAIIKKLIKVSKKDIHIMIDHQTLNQNIIPPNHADIYFFPDL